MIGCSNIREHKQSTVLRFEFFETYGTHIKNIDSDYVVDDAIFSG